MTLTSEEVKVFARHCGADAVGIGSMDRFEGAPMQMNPRYVFPEAKSIIGMLFRIPRGYIRGIEEGTHFFQYPAMGYADINEDFAPAVLYNTGRFIEDRGYEGTVFRNTGGRGPVSDMTGKKGIEESPEEHKRAIEFTREIGPGLPAPDIFFHFRIAAYICGLGEIGYSKMLLSPKFGPLNRQAFILTDAPLEPDPIYDGPPLCNKCMACVKHCPGNCLDSSTTIKTEIAGHSVEWGTLDEWKCFAYYEGASRASNPFLPEDAFDQVPEGNDIIQGKWNADPTGYSRITRKLKEYYPMPPTGYNPPKCGGCLRACLASLEARGVLENKFKNRFRKHKPWKMTAD